MSAEGADEEDMIVVLISKDDDKEDYQNDDEMIIDEVTGELISTKQLKQEVNDEILDQDLFDVVQKYGTPVDIPLQCKNERNDDFECEFLDENSQDSDYVPEEQEECSDNEFATAKNKRSLNKISKKNIAYPHRFKLLTPDESHSFVDDLRKVFPEFDKDQEALILHLSKIMKASKPPPPPDGYCRQIDAKQYECIVCLKITETKAASERHYAEKHGPRYLNCYSCGVDFRCVTNLYKHEKRCLHPDAEIVLRARAICVGFKGANRPFLECYQTRTPTQAAVQRNQQFTCEICNAVFRSNVNLQSHVLLHSGQRPFKCDQCFVAYTSKRRLKRHLKSHAGGRFECDICGRVYPLKSSLSGHMDSHNARRFLCPYGCGRKYASNLALRIHVDSKHLNKPPPCACNICPRRFFKMSLLKVHMKKAHGLLLMTRNMLMKQLPRMHPEKVKSMFGDVAAYVHKGKVDQAGYELNDDAREPHSSSDAFDINTMGLAQFDPDDTLETCGDYTSDMLDIDNPHNSDDAPLITGDLDNFSDKIPEDYSKENSLGCYTLNIDDNGILQIKKEQYDLTQDIGLEDPLTNNKFKVNTNDVGEVTIKQEANEAPVSQTISLEDALKSHKKFKVVVVKNK